MPFLNPELYRKIKLRIRTYNRARRPRGEDFIHFATAFYSFIEHEAERVAFTVRRANGSPDVLLAKEIITIDETAAGWRARTSNGVMLPLVSAPSGRPIIGQPQIDHDPRLAAAIETLFDDLVACREVTQIMIEWRGRDAFYANNRKRTGSGWNDQASIAEMRARVPPAVWRRAQAEMVHLASTMSLTMIRAEDQRHNA